jgi:hypothetical protein
LDGFLTSTLRILKRICGSGRRHFFLALLAPGRSTDEGQVIIVWWKLMAQSVCVIVSAVDRERLEAIVGDRNQRQK